MPSPYDTDEPHDALWLEQSIFASAHIGAIGYGIHIIVFFMCIYYIIKDKNRTLWSLVYAFALFVLASINLGCNINFNEQAWLDYRAYPGGPLAFILNEQARPVDTVGNSAAIIATLLADSLLLWRCYIIWSKKWYIVVIPALMLLSITVLSVFTVIQAARPQASLWSDGVRDFSVPYYSISMALNIGLTTLIVLRLLWTRRRMLGPEHSQVYINIAAMIVESALPYGLVSLIFVILYGLHNTAQNLFLPLLVQVESITPELILLRVSQGRAWSAETAFLTSGGGPRLPPKTFNTVSNSTARTMHGSNRDSQKPNSHNEMSVVNINRTYGASDERLTPAKAVSESSV